MIALDASVLIAYLDRDDGHHAAAEALLTRTLDDALVVSPLTLAEVLVVPVGDGRLESVLRILRDLDVETLPFPADAAVRLAQLRVSTGLKMPDCCVLLAADMGRGSLATFDERMASAARDRGIAVLDG